MNAVDTSESTTGRYRTCAAAKRRDDVDTIPVPGMKMMYTPDDQKTRRDAARGARRRVFDVEEVRADEAIEDELRAREHHRRHREEHHERCDDLRQTKIALG